MSPTSREIVNMTDRLNGFQHFPGKLFLFIILTLLIQQTATNVRNKRLSSITSSQPTIGTENGHLIFQTGQNRDIKFQSSSGGSIFIDEENLKDISETVKNNKRLIQDLRANSNVNTATPDHVSDIVEERLSQLEQGLNNLQPTGAVQEQLASLVDHIITLQNGASTADETVTSLSELIETVRNQVSLLNTQVATLNELLTTDECLTNPCQHGGVCVDQYDGYFCRCPVAWEGPHCEVDVNECYEYAGTDLGCQNGATCRDEEGGFSCDCTANFHGTLCQTTHNDCSGLSHEALCGHGTCINHDRVSAGEAKYICVCDDGWTKSDANPACVIDVNECDLPSQPCSVDPPVSCVNIPGTFHCGPCPAGYFGNGLVCSDINECEMNNGGCSMAPSVECINTRGSRHCGPCPGGYQGNGVTCEYVGVCEIDNGGCHPLANCQENVAVAPGFRSCTCPTGYAGNGVGYGGCVQQTVVVSTVCDNNPCMRQGVCVPQGSSYSCQCYDGYTGHNCETDINECDSFPCQNDGTCTDGVNSYSCVCPNTHTGPQCQTQQDVCGGDLEGDTGNFAYPSQSGTEYDHMVTCIWTITVPSDKVIRLTFTEFDVEASNHGCAYDYLQFRDGSTFVHTEIGTYCGTELPDPITSSHNQLFFLFHSDFNVAEDGFTFNWIAIDPVCGGDMTGSNHGEFTSPGYPGNYPHNRDCVWNIYVDAGQRILFTFATLAIEEHSSCSYDYITIRDGVLATDPILQEYCTTSVPPPLQMSGSSAQVHFHSDGSVDDIGFHITYSVVPADDGCGGLLTEENGLVMSPGYPNSYAVEGVCIWQINVLEGERIAFEFTDMDLTDTSSQCQDAHVELRDGEAEDAPLLGRYCGTEEPAIITSTGNALYIKFQSNVNVHGQGFYANWNVVCGGTFTEDEGIITSPGYPNIYPNERQCQYLISQPEGKVITISFIDFDVESGYAGCVFDYLTVYDSPTIDASKELGRFCGMTVPGPLVSTQNTMLLVFVTDVNGHGRGFKIQYTNTVQGCGGTFTERTGHIQSPTSPEMEYPNGANCTWFISLDPGFVVRLMFHVFSLESHSECDYDYVEVFDHSQSTTVGESIGGRYCGAALPPVLTSSGNTMTVVFISDESIMHEGFSASYVGLDESRICGSDLTDMQGEITSPNFPDNYPGNKHCTWTIVVLAGYQIQLNVTDFSLENVNGDSECEYDSLDIRNGGYPTSPRIGRYCGTTIDHIITSHSNRMWIKFTSDGYIEESGFRITYHAAMTGCGGDLTTLSATITSPGYPMAYHHQAECIWTIRISHGSKVNFIFTDMDIETHNNCIYDYVEIRDGGPTGRSMGTFCGEEIPSHIESSGNSLWVKFSSDVMISGRGFSASYASDCDIKLTSRHGIIESPNFPNPYFANQDCEWTIEMTAGNKVNASFSHFQLEDSNHCGSDYLRITDGAEASGTAALIACGSDIPDDIHSNEDTLFVKFHSNEEGHYDGFRLEYVFDGCGDTFHDDVGWFTSPNYPNRYPNRATCEWLITVDYGSTIELIISEVAIESRHDCGWDSLEVYDGETTDAVRLLQICDDAPHARTLRGHAHNMLVRFTSDYYVTDTGFNITYRAIAEGCGGNFTTPTGTITSKGYPDDYPNNVTCEWLITVDPGHTVELVFEDSHIPSTDSCGTDYVIVYDGPDRNAPELLRHCGSALPDPQGVVSTDNQLYILFQSDESINGKGFKASYDLGCGGIEDADVDGFIASPTSHLLPWWSNNCTWVLQTSDNSKHVTLIFTELNLYQFYSSNCWDYSTVTVYDGDSAASPLIGTYCGTIAPPPITSHGSSLFVHYLSYFFSSASFRASYSTSTSVCGFEFNGLMGAFNSPSYPESYPLETECVWTITGSPGNSLHLAFSMFDIEESDYCNLDYVEVYEGNEDGHYIGRYCGDVIPSNITIWNSAWVKFRSDNQGTGVGFMAQYSYSYFNEITGTSGQITSVLHPKNYPDRKDFVYIITVAENRRIRITFEVLDIEYSYTCYWDWLKIYDGPLDTSPLMHKYCGYNTLPQDIIISASNQLRLEFHSDCCVVGTGFLLNWVATTDVMMTTVAPVSGCGGALLATVTEQTLTSPGYPNGTAPGLDCVWRIVGPSGYKIEFNLTFIDLDSSAGCTVDSVQVFDPEFIIASSLFSIFGFSSQTSNDLGGSISDKYCGRGTDSPQPIRSRGASMNIRLLTGNSDVNNTGFEATYKLACGGLIRGETSGIIRSTYYPEDYPSDSSCIWKIYVANDRTIRVTFDNSDDFDLFGASGNCNNDYITLLNGDNINSPALGDRDNGRYCGNSAPSMMETSDNKLYISFTSDESNSASGFRLHWEERVMTCGYHITLSAASSSQFISSENYPSNYYKNMECEWVIMAPGTDRIHVDFVGDFNIRDGSSSNNCEDDYVLLRDGATSNAPVIGDRYCGSSRPNTQFTHGNVLYVKFRSGNAQTGRGFKAKVYIARCGGFHYGTEGTITSIHNPSDYESNLECLWTFEAPTGHSLTFTFNSFDLESSLNCTKDYLEIREPNSTVITDDPGEVLLPPTCGSSIPSPVITADRLAYIKFVTDSSNAASGFEITYTASVDACGGSLTTPSGSFMSPNFPGQYPHSRTCTWDIEVPIGRSVSLTFDEFEIHTYIGLLCLWDHVQVYNGILSTSLTLARLCGDTPPSDAIRSTGNTMRVVFRTDGSDSNGGFHAHYHSNNDAICGGLLTSNLGNITSPGYGEDGHPHNLQCIWLMENPAHVQSSIVLTFNTFHLEEQQTCDYDFLVVREGFNEQGELIDKYCGNRADIPQIISPGPSLWILFQSDSSVAEAGFFLQYEYTDCGGIMGDQVGAITSPGYSQNYAPNSRCAWKIVAPEGDQIKIETIHFQTEDSSDCASDYVEIFNGGDYNAPSIGRFCGNNGPPEFTTGSNMLRVVFSSDETGSAQGFKLEYTFLTEACGGLYHSDAGNISTPNWPNNYPHNLECEWDINVDPSYYIILTFIGRFEMAVTGTSCSDDYVEVFDVLANGTQVSLGRDCHRTRPDQKQSTNHMMIVKFRSDHGTVGDGFFASWRTVCGATYNADYGQLSSPGFPNNYGANMDCDYVIHVNIHREFILEFTHFSLAGAFCVDYLSVYERINSNARFLGRFCGTTAPQALRIKEDVFMRFHSSQYDHGQGFLADWYTDDCGGLFTDLSGVIRSPHRHPVGEDPTNLNCTYTIMVAIQHIVELTFATFNFEMSPVCEADSLEIFDGPSLTSDSLGRFCGDGLPPRFRSTSNIVTISLQTDETAEGNEFTASYRETLGPELDCGGSLDGLSGSFRSSDADGDGQYDVDLDCQWLITAPDNNIIHLTIESVNMEFSPDCHYDFIKIWDGFAMTENYPASILCGVSSQPFSMLSSSNNLYVQFFSDHVNTGSGFTATYTSRHAECSGYAVATNDLQTLTSPGFPNASPPESEYADCHWMISAPAGENVRLRIINIDIPDSMGCTEHFLSFKDYPMGFLGHEVQYCETTPPPRFDSLGESVQVTYISAAVVANQGMKFTFQIAPDCHRNYALDTDQILSPDYPSLSQRAMDCNILLSTARDTYVTVYFNTFSIEYSDDCTIGHLKIYNGSDASSTELATHCGVQLPNPIFASGNSLFMNFKTQSSIDFAEFNITYTSSTKALGCGGTLTALNSVLTSPGYPGNYTAEETCDWLITVPAYHTITMTFHDFYILAEPDCETDYVEIHLMPSEEIVTEFCGDSLPADLQINSNKIRVRYYSDGTGSSILFKLTYSA